MFLRRDLPLSSATLLLLALFGGCHRAAPASRDAGGDGPGGDVPEAAAPDLATESPGVDAPGDAPPETTVDVAAEAAPEAPDQDGAESGAATDAVADAGADADAAPVPTTLRALMVSIGRYHMCALLENHRVKCWGFNLSGELGLGDTKDRGLTAAEMGDALPFVDLGTGRTAKAVAAGNQASCAILDTDDVKCWGWSGRTSVPSDTATGMNRGDEPGEMGNALPIVNLGAGHKAKRVALGYYEGCVQRDDDSFLCWTGEAAFTTIPARPGHAVVDLQPDQGALALFDDGEVWNVRFGGSPAGFAAPAHAVAGSLLINCAALERGGVDCHGQRKSLEVIKGPVQGLALAESTPNSCALRLDGRVSCFGVGAVRPDWSSSVDEDGGFVAALGQPARAIASSGEFNTCALLVDGGIKCWPWGTDLLASAPWISAGSTPDGTYKGRWLELDLGTRP
jgi:hypothetical protein